MINPTLNEIIKKEVEKMLEAKVIFPVHYSSWVSNIVLVQKKNNKIHIYFDFRNLNWATQKDNFSFLHIQEIIDQVSGLAVISLLDKFSSYNQIKIQQEDKLKIKFMTP